MFTRSVTRLLCFLASFVVSGNALSQVERELAPLEEAFPTGFYVGLTGGVDTGGISSWLPLSDVDIIQASAIFDKSLHAAVMGAYLRRRRWGQSGAYVGAGAITVHRDHILSEGLRFSDAYRGAVGLAIPSGAYYITRAWPVQFDAQIAVVGLVSPTEHIFLLPSFSIRYGL